MKLWYAVIGKDQNPDYGYDCGHGSDNIDEAIAMAEKDEFIAVMDVSDGDAMCIGEIKYNSSTGNWEQFNEVGECVSVY